MAKPELMVLTKMAVFGKKVPSPHEEQKRILKICVTKLQQIHDPESVLHRSVLINNTLKNLQQRYENNTRKKRLKRTNIDMKDQPENKKACISDHDYLYEKEECLSKDVDVDSDSDQLSYVFYDSESADCTDDDNEITEEYFDIEVEQISGDTDTIINSKDEETEGTSFVKNLKITLT